MSDNVNPNDDRMAALHEVLVGILDRLTTVESLLKDGSVPKGSSADNEAPTRRMKNERGDWVIDVTGLASATDKDTGEEGFWARSKKGNWYLVDKQGYPMFDDDRPLKKEGAPV